MTHWTFNDVRVNIPPVDPTQYITARDLHSFHYKPIRISDCFLHKVGVDCDISLNERLKPVLFCVCSVYTGDMHLRF